MRRFLIAAAAALALCGTPALARAEMAFTTSGVNLRAGPDVYYPRVSYLPGGEEVEVVGCLDDWSWCDVIAFDERGWVAADYLEYPYDGRTVLIPEYGPRLGLSIVGFSFGYWDSHYRHRSWYGRRDYWRNYSASHPRVYGGYSRYSGSSYRDGRRYDGRRYDGRADTRTYVAPRTSSTYYRDNGTVTSGSWRERARVQQERQANTYQRQQQATTYQRQVERNARAESRTDYSAVERQRARQESSTRVQRQQEAQRVTQRNAIAAQNQAARIERQQTPRSERAYGRERAEERHQLQAERRVLQQERQQERQVPVQQREQVRAQVAQQQRVERQAEHREAQAEKQAQKREYARNKKDKDDKD